MIRRIRGVEHILQDMSVAIAKDGHVLFGTDMPAGIYRFPCKEGGSLGEPIVKSEGGVAADPSSDRWAAATRDNLRIFEKAAETANLSYPKDMRVYYGGVLAFAPDGTLVVALESAAGVELAVADIKLNAFRTLCSWNGDRLVSFALGPRLPWSRPGGAGSSAAASPPAPGTAAPLPSETAQDLMNRGAQCEALGEYAKAETLFRKALEIRKKVPGENHPDYARSLNSRALAYWYQGDYARAEPLYRRALEIYAKVLGKNCAGYAESLDYLACEYLVQADNLRAEPLFRQAAATWKKVLGEDHPQHARGLNNLACLYLSQRDYQRAESLYRKSLEIRKKALGENNPDYARSLSNLASLYQEQGDDPRTERLLRQALEIYEKVPGGNHGYVEKEYAESLINLAGLYQDQGDYSRAEPPIRQALQIRKRILGVNHPDYAAGLHDLAHLYQRQGDYARAEPLFRQAAMLIRRHVEATATVQSERQQLAMLQHAHHYLNCYLTLAAASGRYSEPAYRELLAWKGMSLRRNRPARAVAQGPELAATFARLQRVGAPIDPLGPGHARSPARGELGPARSKAFGRERATRG